MQPPRIRIMLDIANVVGRRVTRGILEYAKKEENWSFDHPAPPSASAADWPQPAEAEGVIGRVAPELCALWRSAGKRALVNVSRAEDVDGAANVTVDDRQIARIAADYLLAKDLAHYLFINFNDTGGARNREFARALGRAGRPVTVIAPPESDDQLFATLAELPRPIGVLAFNDPQAAYLVNRLIARGFHVPRDVAVVGADNDEFEAMFASVPLTSIDPDFERVGYEAATVLGRILRGQHPPAEPIRIPPKGLVERQSTDFPGELDELAVAAARIIRQRACRGLSVEQLVAALPTTYRTLDRRFQKAFGESLYQQITRLRLEEATVLLTQTDLTVTRIAQRVGFNHATYFCTAFKKRMGLTPDKYRRHAT